METEKRQASILVDLDSIMDTRIPVLFSISEKITQEVIHDGSYFKRKKDNFKNISADIFQPMYNNRTKLVLKLATPTELLRYLSNYIIEMKADLMHLELINETFLYINTFPYVLNNDELEYLKIGISNYLPDINLKFVHMSISELTPEWVNNNLETLMLYDGLKWLEYHTATTAIMKHSMQNKILITPSISNGQISETLLTNDFFTELQSSLRSIINYIPLPSIFYTTKSEQKK